MAILEGWLEGLGLGMYRDLLLREGWDSVEVRCGGSRGVMKEWAAWAVMGRGRRDLALLGWRHATIFFVCTADTADSAEWRRSLALEGLT